MRLVARSFHDLHVVEIPAEIAFFAGGHIGIPLLRRADGDTGRSSHAVEFHAHRRPFPGLVGFHGLAFAVGIAVDRARPLDDLDRDGHRVGLAGAADIRAGLEREFDVGGFLAADFQGRQNDSGLFVGRSHLEVSGAGIHRFAHGVVILKPGFAEFLQRVAGAINVFRTVLRTESYAVGAAVHGDPVEILRIIGVSHGISVVGIGIERLRDGDPLGEFSARDGEMSGAFAGGFIGLRFERYGNASFSGRFIDIEPFGIGRDDIPPVCKTSNEAFEPVFSIPV